MNWASASFSTGSIVLGPASNVIRTGSTGGFAGFHDRTGQLVREGESPELWLVRESTGAEHTIVNERNEEQTLKEGSFFWENWRKIAG